MKRTLCSSLFVLTLLSLARPTHAQFTANGFIDTAFSASCFASPGVNFTTRVLFVQPDGRILVGFTPSSSCGNALLRLRTNGVVDGTFATPFLSSDLVTAIATQSNGKTIVGGRLSAFGTVFPAARLNANGAIDGTFSRLTTLAYIANAIAVQPDDKVIVAGSLDGMSGFVIRMNDDGTVDNSFTNGVTGATPSGQGISALAIQSSKVLVGGSFSIFNAGAGNTNRESLVRLNPNGSLDGLFRPLISNADVRALLIQPDGKILVAGQFDFDGQVSRFVARLNSDGTRDLTFTNLNGLGITALSLALEPDGKILVGHTLGIMRLTANGTIDETFGPLNAPGFFGTDAMLAAAVALSLDGNVLVGATRVGVNGTERRGVARLFANLPPPPGIVTQPVTQTVESGTNATFSVIATGAPPVTFQWRKDGTKLKGATNSVLSLFNVHSTDTANYSVVVANPGGAVTSVLARLIVNFHTSPLDIVVNGGGKVTPNLDGRELEIGQTFTLTAKPTSGNLFSNWTGFETTNSPVLTFVMQSNEVLQANFVPSPFIPVVGVYNGLFFNTNAPAHENAGFITLKLDARGGFKGTVLTGAKKRKISGVFSLEDVAQVTVPASGVEAPLSLALHIDTVNGVITGTASNSTAISSLTADRNSFSSAAPSSLAGNYNIALPGSDAPAGDGFAAVKVSANGKVSGRGTLADKSALKIVSAVTVDGRVPVYVSLYRGSGSLFGWLTIAGDDVSGTVWWTKPGTFGGTFYPLGFTNRIDVLGSRYTAVPRGTPVLTLTNGIVILAGGNLAEPFTNSIVLGGDNKIVGDNRLTLTISTAKGALSGSFVDPTSGKKRSVKGVALSNRNEARGLFFGPDESGRVFIGEAAP